MENFDHAAFAARLTALRKEKGLTQSALAEQIGITDKTYSRWETGESLPDPAALAALAGVYGCSAALFFGEERREFAARLDGLAPADMVQEAFALQFEAIRGLAGRAFGQKWWEKELPANNPPPNRVSESEHAVTAYADDDCLFMMHNGNDANIALSLLPNADNYAWLTEERARLAGYFALLGQEEALALLTFLLSDRCEGRITADFAAENAGISPDRARELLSEMAALGMVEERLTHIGQKELVIYRFVADHKLTGMLTLTHLSLPDYCHCGQVYFSHNAHVHVENKGDKS